MPFYDDDYSFENDFDDDGDDNKDGDNDVKDWSMWWCDDDDNDTHHDIKILLLFALNHLKSLTLYMSYRLHLADYSGD